jgi:hypothetical protein
MKAKTKHLLYEAWAWCDIEDKSTEFMFQYMADKAEVTQHQAMNFMADSTPQKRKQWYTDNPDWYKAYQ